MQDRSEQIESATELGGVEDQDREQELTEAQERLLDNQLMYDIFPLGSDL